MTLFSRRRKRGLSERVMTALWPRAGWRRVGRYYVLRLKRLPGTPASIACGLACGVAMAPSPFIGLHLVIAGSLAWLLGGSVLAALLGTLVLGNPWVVPLLLAGDFEIGHLFIGSSSLATMPVTFSLHDLIAHPVSMFIPLFVGAALIGGVLWPVTYFPTRALITRHRAQSLARRQARMVQAQEDASEPAR